MKDKLINAALIFAALAVMVGLWCFSFWLELKFLELKLWFLGK